MESHEKPEVMGDYTSIRVTEELADDLHNRKNRGDSYEDVIWRLIEAAAGEYVLEDSQKAITYGPSSEVESGYVLTVTTANGGRVDLHLPEDTMYGLWTEVQHSPWPDTLDEQDEAAELRQQLVDRAMGADADALRDALDALDPHWQER